MNRRRRNCLKNQYALANALPPIHNTSDILDFLDAEANTGERLDAESFLRVLERSTERPLLPSEKEEVLRIVSVCGDMYRKEVVISVIRSALAA